MAAARRRSARARTWQKTNASAISGAPSSAKISIGTPTTSVMRRKKNETVPSAALSATYVLASKVRRTCIESERYAAGGVATRPATPLLSPVATRRSVRDQAVARELLARLGERQVGRRDDHV